MAQSKNARRRARRAASKKTTSGNNNRVAAVAKALKPSIQNDSKLRLSGMDRLAHVEDVSTYSTGAVVLSHRIEPEALSRLSRVASIFQRIKYLQLRFDIRAQMPTTASGGYVVGFIRDPSDLTNRSDALNFVTSQAGSQTLNWWGSTTIRVPVTPDLLFTNQVEGEGLRNCSPGQLVIVCDGPAHEKGSLSVNCTWSVELSEASFEEEEVLPISEVTVPEDFRFYNKYDTGTTYKCALMNADRSYTTIQQMGIPANTYWKLPHPVTYVLPDGDDIKGVLSSRFVCAWDQPTNGSICPAVLTSDGLIDLNEDFGDFSWSAGHAPLVTGCPVSIHAGETWIQVDRRGKPTNLLRMSPGQFRAAVQNGSMVSTQPHKRKTHLNGTYKSTYIDRLLGHMKDDGHWVYSNMTSGKAIEKPAAEKPEEGSRTKRDVSPPTSGYSGIFHQDE